MEKSKIENFKLLITENISYRKNQAETVDETFQIDEVSRMNSNSRHTHTCHLSFFCSLWFFIPVLLQGSKNRYGVSTRWF